MQNNISHHSSNPQKEILRLIYPQWQGGDIAGWFGDLSQSEASQGYILGAQILNLIVDCILSSSEHSTIAPSKAHSAYSSKHHTAIVPINRDFIVDDSGHRIVQEGIIDKEVLASQTKSALEILSTHKPAKILTLGGECAISVPPFTYLAQMYKDEIAMVWIDAHPDIALPNDDFYKGYHAMAVSAIIGKGGLKESFSLPSHLESSKVLLVGLHSKEAEHYAKRQREFGLVSLSPSEVAQDSSKILEWLKGSGAKKVMIHLDLDVLDSKELYVAVGNTGQMKIEQVGNIINEIARDYELVGLSIAEHLPKAQIKLKRLLENLPLNF